MASSSISPYRNNANTESFALVSSDTDGCTFKVAGRALANPYVFSVKRKVTAPTAKGNDHVVVRVARTESNAETGIPATAQVLLDISIPKDQTILTATILKELCSIISSYLNEETAMEATTANITTLIEGMDP